MAPTAPPPVAVERTLIEISRHLGHDTDIVRECLHLGATIEELDATVEAGVTLYDYFSAISDHIPHHDILEAATAGCDIDEYRHARTQLPHPEIAAALASGVRDIRGYAAARRHASCIDSIDAHRCGIRDLHGYAACRAAGIPHEATVGAAITGTTDLYSLARRAAPNRPTTAPDTAPDTRGTGPCPLDAPTDHHRTTPDQDPLRPTTPLQSPT